MTMFNKISDMQINEQDSMIHNSGVRDHYIFLKGAAERMLRLVYLGIGAHHYT